jgi:hypothetical protein
MSEQERIVPEGFKENARGDWVPVANIKAKDLMQEEVVDELYAEAMELREKMAAFKAKCFERLDDFRILMDQEYNAPIGGAGGNATFKSFDGRKAVSIDIDQSVEFGPELEQAKKLIDLCLLDWSEGANSNLVTFVYQAFDVNKAGKVDMDRVRGLKNFDIPNQDDRWDQAMKVIEEAVRPVSSKRAIRFKEKDDTTGKMVGVSLNFSAL